MPVLPAGPGAGAARRSGPAPPSQVTDKSLRAKSANTLDVLLSEGLTGIRAAAAEAGVPRLSYWAVLRAWRSGRLEALKIGGRVMTSAAAIRRWILQTNERLLVERAVVPSRRMRRSRPVTSEAERRFLESRGLPSGRPPRGERGQTGSGS